MLSLCPISLRPLQFLFPPNTAAGGSQGWLQHPLALILHIKKKSLHILLFDPVKSVDLLLSILCSKKKSLLGMGHRTAGNTNLRMLRPCQGPGKPSREGLTPRATETLSLKSTPQPLFSKQQILITVRDPILQNVKTEEKKFRYSSAFAFKIHSD